ncbi:MAG TPA: endonuclease [Tepidisphaeraceae bacterium]
MSVSAPAVRADYEAPLPQYGPGAYYDGINPASPGTLKAQLKTRLEAGFVRQSYDNYDNVWEYIDGDPANPPSGTSRGRVITIYDRRSVAANATGTINKEHQWVNSRLPDDVPNDDFFNIRPCDIDINNLERGSLNYNATAPVNNTTTKYGQSSGYFFPGHADKGDTARVLFYMATKYSDTLSLVNGNPTSGNRMGDLASLLRNNYSDGVDNFERRRNVNVQGYQKNRNPFVDHPEYVWAVFGGGNNDAQLAVAAVAADGSSATTRDLGRIITGGTLATATATINKIGAAPTTLDITASGVVTSAAGAGQVIDYGTQARTLALALPAGSNTGAGRKSGTVTIDNTDLTNSATGRGSADGNDVITVTASVLDHANASFSDATDVNSTTIDLGTFTQGPSSKSVTLADVIFNRESLADFTAALDLDTITELSDAANRAALTGAIGELPAGDSADLTATLDLSTPGSFSATYRLGFSDENLSGATAFGSELLTLTLTGTVVAVPEPAALCALAMGLIACGRRRR